MQCHECGFQIGAPAQFCPACGTRQVVADPNAGSAQGAVQSPSYLGADAPTRAQPIVPAAVRPPRPAPQPASEAPSRSAGVPDAGAPRDGGARLSHPSASGEAVPITPGAIRPPAIPAAGAAAGSAAGAAVVGKPGAPRKASPQPGDILGDRFRVEKFLGQGSLSNAYLCRDARNGNREVVIRAMHLRKAAEPGLADNYLFLAESVSKYDHRGIARIFETGRLGETPYYAMEWVSGTPLRMWLMERLTFENRVLPGLGIVRGLIDIFEAIHERGCYGCLKPENVFIGLGGPVVMDFGLVGFLSPQEFEFNSYARRYLPYMAPELRQDWSNLIPHSDYYSLGAILYEVLTGRPPTAPLRLPSELSDRFGIEADEVVLKAMAQKPLDRFGTLEAFRAAVESLQAAFLDPQAQPGIDEGSRTLRVASGAGTVLNPDETFTSTAPLAPPPDGAASRIEEMPAASEGSLNGNIWSREPSVEAAGPLAAPIAEAPAESAGNPYASEAPSEGAVLSAFSGLAGSEDEGATEAAVDGEASGGAPGEPRQAEAAHAMRRFTRSPRGAFPEGELPVVPAEGALRPLSQAVDWEGLAGQTQAVPEPEAEAAEEPVPAWLWISIALAGCSMVVLSAYFGLLLPR